MTPLTAEHNNSAGSARAVASRDPSARGRGLRCTQIDPLFAAADAVRHLADVVCMDASVWHRTPLRFCHDGWLAVRRGQKSMQRRHHLRALADRGGDPLDRTGTDVADSKDAAATGFQRTAIASGVFISSSFYRVPHTFVDLFRNFISH